MKKPLMCICSVYLASLFVYVFLYDTMKIHTLMVLFTCVSLLMCAIGAVYACKRKSIALLTAGLTVILTSLTAAFYINNVWLDTLSFCGHYERISATVQSISKSNDKVYKYAIRIDELDGEKVNIKAYYYNEDGRICDVDDKIAFTGELEEFTSDDYYRAKGIFLRIDRDYNNESLSVEKAQKRTWRYGIQAFRDFLERKLEENSADVAVFAKAVMLGDKSGLGFSTEESFRRAGLSHVFAVSGLHLSFISTAVYGVLSRITAKRRVAAAVNMAVVVLFMAVTGFSASVMRAGIMTLLFYGAKLFGTNSDSKTSLVFAASLLCAVNPFAVTDVSLQLSFCATLGILLLYSPIYERMAKILPKQRIIANILSYLFSAVAVTVAASIGVLPITAIVFSSVQTLSVVSNLLCVWAVSAFFMAELVMVAVGKIPFISDVGRGFIKLLSEYITNCANLISDIPFASVYVPKQLAFLLVFYAAICVLLYLLFKKYEAKVSAVIPILGAVAILIVYAAFSGFYSIKQANVLEITAVDVGQGNCIVAQKDGKACMIDCGSESDGAATNAIAFLRENGVSRLEFIAVTHYHKDHVNGIIDVMKTVKTDAVILPPIPKTSEMADAIKAAATECGAEIIIPESDLLITALNGVSVYVLSDYFYQTPNDETQSMTVMLDYNNSEFLTTGDMSSQQEMLLAEYGDKLDCDVFMAGHHGSEYSNSDKLLSQITPEIVIASAGKNNSYGHPTVEAVARFDWIGARLYRTDRDGNITVRTSGNSVFEIAE